MNGQQLRGIREVKLADDNTYKVMYTVNAIISLQKKYKSLQNVFSEFEKGLEMDFQVFIDFLHVGLQKFHKEMTIEEVGDLVDFFNFSEVLSDLFGGMKDAVPTNNDGQPAKSEELPEEVQAAMEAAKKKD